jgi:hypothetical protein
MFATFPQGEVILELYNPAFGRELVVYIEGAREAVRFTAIADTGYTITFDNVADYGADVRQYVRVLELAGSNSAPCRFDLGLFADVRAGESVSAGEISLVVNDYQCPYAFGPSWHADGDNVTYLFREASRNLSPHNNIWQASANPPLGSNGEARVLDMEQYTTVDKLYRVVMGPATRSSELFILQNGALITPIYRATVEDAENNVGIDLGLCPTINCDVLGIVWLPDGSGFLFARAETDSSGRGVGVLYRYDFADEVASEILRLPTAFIGKIAVAPDGSTVVFERDNQLNQAVETVRLGPSLLCPCELWMGDIDGSNLRLLVEDGRAPAWSSLAPVIEPPPGGSDALRLFVSFVT